MKRLVIATRGSRLALAQTHSVAGSLRRLHPGLQVELAVITTKGDRILDKPLASLGGKGIFVKEVEDALLQRRARLAVHSMKDLPPELPESLTLAAVTQREDHRDVLIGAEKISGLADLPPEAQVGTGSLRRQAQLLALRPDLRIVPLRGSVETRLAKLRTQGLQGIVLAAAGLKRLRLPLTGVFLETSQMLPAVGQGALGVEIRKDDEEISELLRPLNHQATWSAVQAERAFAASLGGGCQTPLAAYAYLQDEHIFLEGLLADLRGVKVIRARGQAPASAAAVLGQNLAADILARGGAEIIARLNTGETS